MPAAEPKKDQIAEAIKTALEGVLVGAGYYTDLGKNVTRRLIGETEVSSLSVPCASIECGDGEPSPVSCTGSYRQRFSVFVSMYFRAEKVENLDREGSRVEADCNRAVLADSQLGLAGTVVQVQPGNTQVAFKQFGDDRLGLKVNEYVVDYNWTAASP